MNRSHEASLTSVSCQLAKHPDMKFAICLILFVVGLNQAFPNLMRTQENDIGKALNNYPGITNSHSLAAFQPTMLEIMKQLAELSELEEEPVEDDADKPMDPMKHFSPLNFQILG